MDAWVFYWCLHNMMELYCDLEHIFVNYFPRPRQHCCFQSCHNHANRQSGRWVIQYEIRIKINHVLCENNSLEFIIKWGIFHCWLVWIWKKDSSVNIHSHRAHKVYIWWSTDNNPSYCWLIKLDKSYYLLNQVPNI